MPSDYSKEHIRQMMDPRHDQTPFQKKRNKTTGEKLYGYHPQELLTKKILPPDVFYKLFRSEKIS